MDNLEVILVSPQGPMNVGSVCRAMKNFGFTKLRLVSPTPKYKNLAAKKMAMTAFDILENAPVFDDLASALADIQVAFGTTRRFGKYRKHFYTPSGAAAKICEATGDTKMALVMGPEDTGLETRDLDLCQHFITIPTHDGYPSMNLSHALCVLLYEVSQKSEMAQRFYDPTDKKQLASSKENEHLFSHMRKTLLDIDYLDPQNPDHLLRAFRRIFAGSGLSSRDVRILEGLMSRIDWTEAERRKHAHVHHS